MNAGAVHSLHRFPAVIGRHSTAQVRLEEPGIWDRHLSLDFAPDEGFILQVLPGPWAMLNGCKFQRAVLHSGDLIELGGLKLQFWLSQTRQRSLELREGLTWTSLGLLCAAQVAIIYLLLP
jgi:pSer/pThr/pTyr-binding forkhead associated (FHA) protein